MSVSMCFASRHKSENSNFKLSFMLINYSFHHLNFATVQTLYFRWHIPQISKNILRYDIEFLPIRMTDIKSLNCMLIRQVLT